MKIIPLIKDFHPKLIIALTIIVVIPLFYFIIGLIFLAKILQLYFPNYIVSMVLFCITFGTNTLYYLTVGGGMSHAVNFGLIAGFIYYTIKWHQKSGKGKVFKTSRL